MDVVNLKHVGIWSSGILFWLNEIIQSIGLILDQGNESFLDKKLCGNLVQWHDAR